MMNDYAGITLVLGGISSGKSEFAEAMLDKLHKESDSEFYYFTPAPEPEDDEMRAKVDAHRSRRPEWLKTIECGTGPAAALSALQRGDTVLLDSLGTLLSRFMDEDMYSAGAAVEEQLKLLAEESARMGIRIILVSEEVGMSLVALSEAGRVFQRTMGNINRLAAALSEEVFFVTAGIPQKIK